MFNKIIAHIVIVQLIESNNILLKNLSVLLKNWCCLTEINII